MKVYTDKQIEQTIIAAGNAWRVCNRITSSNAVHVSGLVRSYLRMIISDLTGKSEEEVENDLYSNNGI